MAVGSIGSNSGGKAPGVPSSEVKKPSGNNGADFDPRRLAAKPPAGTGEKGAEKNSGGSSSEKAVDVEA